MSDTGPITVRAGQIVLADWRGDALPKEPNKLRPAVVVDGDDLFIPAFPNVILVPLTDDSNFVIRHLAVGIAPNAENGCPKPCWAISHSVTTTSKARIRPTNSRITAAQLAEIRQKIAASVGFLAGILTEGNT